MKINKIGIISDIHLPYEHTLALNKALFLLKVEKPDVIVANGDILDFPGLSRYTQMPNFNKLTIHDELVLGLQFFSDLRKQHPKARIVYVNGNHDHRIASYTIRLAPELFQYIDLVRDLKLNELGVEFIKTQEGAAKWTDTFFSIEDVVIGHFDTVSNPVIPSGMTIRSIMQKKIKSQSVIQSHIHRGAIIWDTNENGKTRFGVECPCLCKDAFYSGFSNWQRGLVFIDRTEQGWRPRLICF